MPAYCRSCPYNKFCKGSYIPNPSCPMGYTPFGHDVKEDKTGVKETTKHSGHIFETEILVKIGKAAANKNDYLTGIECYEKALELKPDDSEVSFLLKRTNFMLNEESGNATKKAAPVAAGPESKKTSYGMLPQQDIKSVQIKPKQKMVVDPHIIISKNDPVYQVQGETSSEGRDMEDVSRHVARKTKGSVMRKKGMIVALGLSVTIILMIVVGLWVFGFLEF